ncbi:MAG: hypothetical protein ABI300_07480 [Rhodanobacter sp.]
MSEKVASAPLLQDNQQFVPAIAAGFWFNRSSMAGTQLSHYNAPSFCFAPAGKQTTTP